MNDIPTIDLTPVWDSSKGMQQVAQQIHDVYTSIGFAYIINHKVPKKIIQQAFQAAYDFHALPLEHKMAIKQNDCFRGYVPINASQLKISTQGEARRPNQMESFVMAFEVDKANSDYQKGTYLAGPNQWPNGLVNFKHKVLAYRDAMLDLSYQLIQLFSLALGCHRGDLDRYFLDPTYILRLQHYPPQNNLDRNTYGLAPHTDYGFLSLLAQSEVEGLQVKHPKKGWLTVPYREDALVMNTGDILKRWSNNTFLSTPHRVINQSDQPRYSIPFFFDPNRHAQIEVLANHTREGENPIYPSIKYGDYLLERIQGNYGVGKKD